MSSPLLEDLAGDFVLDPISTRLGFVARRAPVMRVRGAFEQFSGFTPINPTNSTRSRAVVEIEAATLACRAQSSAVAGQPSITGMTEAAS